jgi:hypothetical protein
MLKEESIVTDKSIQSVNPQAQGSTPGQHVVSTPGGGGTPGQDGLQELSDGDGEFFGKVSDCQIIPFKTLPYFLVRKDDFIQVFQISQANELKSREDKHFFNRYVRQIEASATIVAEIDEGKFLLYGYRDDTFMTLDALQDQLSLVNVRFKNVHETTIKDIELHPMLWGNEHAYAVYVNFDN